MKAAFMSADNQAILLQAIRSQLHNLEETIATLNAITTEAPRSAQWDRVRDQVSCLDSVADVIRQALDALRGQ